MCCQDIREETVDYLVSVCRSGDESDRIILLARLRALVALDVTPFLKHKQMFEEFVTNANLRDDSQFIVDVIDGKS